VRPERSLPLPDREARNRATRNEQQLDAHLPWSRESMIAAKLSFTEMTSLMEKMPAYSAYRTEHQAADAERVFRRALGMMLKECGDHLLNVVERKAQILSSEHEHLIDSLVDRIGLIFRRLDREGDVCLVGNCDRTINELEELDTRLILLVEEALRLVRNLGSDIPAAEWFKTDASLLSCDLANFSEMTEERNYLLGLGWESEFTMPGRPTT
jgi:hypothetical protein